MLPMAQADHSIWEKLILLPDAFTADEDDTSEGAAAPPETTLTVFAASTNPDPPLVLLYCRRPRPVRNGNIVARISILKYSRTNRRC